MMSEGVVMSEHKQSAWRSPWVIGIGVMIVIFLAANAVMIFLATGRGPGLVVNDYYSRGQDYEQNMLKRLAKDPGWSMTIEAPGFVDVAKPSVFRYRVATKEGAAVTPDTVVLHAYRPSDAKADFSAPMTRGEDGVYQVEVSFPLKGVWDVLVSATQGEEEYSTHRRISAGVNTTWDPNKL